MKNLADRIEKMIANFDEEAPAITPEEVVDLLEDCRNCIEDQDAHLSSLEGQEPINHGENDPDLVGELMCPRCSGPADNGQDRSYPPNVYFCSRCTGESIATSTPPAVPRPADDDLWDQTMQERDLYHEWADQLADAIASHMGVDIGEHSSSNNPWALALEALETAPQREGTGENS